MPRSGKALRTRGPRSKPKPSSSAWKSVTVDYQEQDKEFTFSKLSLTDKFCIALFVVAILVLVFEVLALNGVLPTPCELTRRFEIFTCN